MAEQRPFYVTTAIPYVNAPPHIGHALLFVYTDATARYERLLGKDVRFVTGTDEHGQKIAQKAAEATLAPRAFVDQISQTVRDMVARLNISNTDFVRTTEGRHRQAVEAFWKRVEANGHIYKKRYGGLYCIGCEQFKTEKELIDGKCPDHLIVPDYIEEENYFFRLSSFAPQLRELYATHPHYVVPDSRFNEMKQLVESGLEDMSISRSAERLSWGIPVPGDPTQVIYVWFDALINYLTGAGFALDEAEFVRYWPADVHFLGQEINRFHSILWVAMLMAAKLDVPKQFAVHGWITVDGKKMSKTLGNVISPEDLATTFTVDGMRYLLLREFSFWGDGDYSRERFLQRYESDLANDLGNLVYRVTSMLQKYRDGVVPQSTDGDRPVAWDDIGRAMGEYRFDLALEAIWNVIREANQLVDQSKPWTLAKEGKDAELDAVLYRLLETVRQIGWMVRPFMPTTSDKILRQLGQETADATIDAVSVWGGLRAGTRLESGEPLFPRLEA